MYIAYPDVCRNMVNIFYSKKGDKAAYDFTSPSQKYPEAWDPYNTKYQ